MEHPENDRRVVAAITGVHFYNVLRVAHGCFPLWCVQFTRAGPGAAAAPGRPTPVAPRPAERGPEVCFVLGEKMSHTGAPAHPDLQEPHIGHLAHADFMEWEIAQRVKNPLIAGAFQGAGRLFRLTLSSENILRGLEELSSDSRIPLAGAYFYGSCKTSTPEPPSDKAPGDNPRAREQECWFHDFRDETLEELEIYIKTKDGMYAFSTSDPPGERSAKRARGEELPIHDIFAPADAALTVEDHPFKLRVVRPPYHVLWAHRDATWNGSLVSFMQSLYRKTYPETYTGVKPVLAYAFPRGAPSGSTFPPFFPSFPFTPIKFDQPRSLTSGTSGPPFDARILMDVCRGVSQTPTANLLILPSRAQQRALHERAIPYHGPGWPAWHSEMNLAMCDGEDEHTIHIREPCTFLEVDFNAALCHLLALRAPGESTGPPRPAAPFRDHGAPEVLQDLVAYGDATARSRVANAYNYTLHKILKHFSQHGFTWVAIHRGAVYFTTPDAQISESEVSRLSASAFPSSDVATVPFNLVEFHLSAPKALAIAHVHGELFISRHESPASHSPPADTPVTSWTSSLHALAQQSDHGSPSGDIASRISAMMPTYFQNRRNADFWTVSQMHVAETPKGPLKPPRAIDCRGRKNRFIKTLAGFVCWNDAWETPVSVDYYYYLLYAAQVMSKLCGREDPIDPPMTTRLDGMARVLSLL
ncbi:helicase-primase subunit [Common bottlenose dolphin gammaherpesvirus 1 strain Sarasota]|uniref:Helicase-primase subunit n=1 Tax=Common bottlenose dolphin gammaherpesvirus 1 strain Sarasota TaxID=2022783 RepID=A0A1Z1NEI7_9GAMA|nr:helicase-primase subunit [Common bottlenose dolphin gammaherpesvirus 1 strain Sarasota]ARW78103.1 helicase-primase subunit [Common bottlenose dolphin gammaherpesvirus 1 strain Sarasota]